METETKNETVTETTEAAPKTAAKKSAAKAPKSFNLRDMAEGRKDILLIDPNDIQVKDNFNVREDYGDMQGLKKSIEANGVKVPLRIFVENNVIFVEDGHRRLRAVKELIKNGAKIKSVPCIPEERGISEEDRVLGLLTYNDGKPLTTMEEAHVIERLLNFNWTPQDIAKATGRSQAHISNLKLLLNVPKEVQNEIQDGNIAATYVMELKRQCGDDQEKLKKTVAKAKEKAKELGKKRATKKIAEEGTTKKKTKKQERSVLIDLLKQAINAIRSKDEKVKAEALDALEEYANNLVGITSVES